MYNEMEPLFSRRRKNDSKLSNTEIFFLGSLMLIMMIVGIFTAVDLPEKLRKSENLQNLQNSADVVLDIVILFNLILANVYLIHGVFCKYYIDVLLCSFSMAMVIIYILVDFIYTDAINSALSVSRLVAVTLSAPLIVSVVYLLIKNYLHNRLLMATKSIIRMYDSLNIIFSLLKFDLQLNITFAIFYIVSDMNRSYKIFYICFILVFSIVQFLIGRISLKKEIASTLYFYIFLYTISIYFIQFEYFWKVKSHYNDKNEAVKNILINQSFLFTCLIALIVRVYMYIQIMNCFKNFNYGLTDDEFVNLAKNDSLFGQRKRRYMYM